TLADRPRVVAEQAKGTVEGPTDRDGRRESLRGDLPYFRQPISLAGLRVESLEAEEGPRGERLERDLATQSSFDELWGARVFESRQRDAGPVADAEDVKLRDRPIMPRNAFQQGHANPAKRARPKKHQLHVVGKDRDLSSGAKAEREIPTCILHQRPVSAGDRSFDHQPAKPVARQRAEREKDPGHDLRTAEVHGEYRSRRI